MLKQYLILTLLFISILNAQERSMFGAGDLNSPTPYGLSSTEKVIVKNKKALLQNEKRIKRVDSKLHELSERIDGIESIFVGDGKKLNTVYNKFNKHIKTYEEQQRKNQLYQTTNDELFEQYKLDTKSNLESLKSLIEQNDRNIKLLKESLDDVVKLVNDINKNHITRKEFNTLLEMIDKKSTKKTSSNNKFSKQSKKKLMAEVRILFKKDYFTKALPIIDYLIEENYRPAECNYYKAEIKYYRKKYKEALSYFKTSMMLYDKAKYLPRLLLHSAISFEKLGDKENAMNFYNTLIEVYPSSNEAKQASQKIN